MQHAIPASRAASTDEMVLYAPVRASARTIWLTQLIQVAAQSFEMRADIGSRVVVGIAASVGMFEGHYVLVPRIP